MVEFSSLLYMCHMIIISHYKSPFNRPRTRILNFLLIHNLPRRNLHLKQSLLHHNVWLFHLRVYTLPPLTGLFKSSIIIYDEFWSLRLTFHILQPFPPPGLPTNTHFINSPSSWTRLICTYNKVLKTFKLEDFIDFLLQSSICTSNVGEYGGLIRQSIWNILNQSFQRE